MTKRTQHTESKPMCTAAFACAAAAILIIRTPSILLGVLLILVALLSLLACRTPLLTRT